MERINTRTKLTGARPHPSLDGLLTTPAGADLTIALAAENSEELLLVDVDENEDEFELNAGAQ